MEQMKELLRSIQPAGAVPSVLVSTAVADDRPSLAPQPRLSPGLGLAAAGPDSLLMDCTESVRSTIANARAPSTRLQYVCK